MRKVVAIFVFAALLGTGFAVAQETTGLIKGVVSSQDGATLPGVTVTINDTDTGLQRTAITNTKGVYQFVALQPGRYAFTANLDGFQTIKRNVVVSVGRSTRNDFDMALGAITDVIEVTGEAPLVDVTSTVTGITVSTDELNGQIPIGREATMVALLAPSTTQGDTAFDSGYTPGQSLASLGGASVAENSYQVNGLNITNFRNGLGSSAVPFEFVEEIQVKTGGYAAEYGRSTGGVINMVTKSGSNSFHGGASIYYEPKSLQEQEANTYNRENQAEETESLEANATFGGPLWQDKLFFFGFVKYTDDEWWTNISSEDPDAGNGFQTNNTLSEPYWGGKVDFNITPSHRVEGTFITDDVELESKQYGWDRTGGTGLAEFQGLGVQQRGGDNIIGKYTGIFTENFLISAQYGTNDFNRSDVATTDEYPYAYDTTSGAWVPIGQWVNWSRGTTFDERKAYRLDGDVYVGSHSIRAGIDYEDNYSFDLTAYSGGVYYRYDIAGNQGFTEDMNGNALDPDQGVVRIRHLDTGGGYDTSSNALYAQDSWAVTSNMTVNFGVRYEEFENKNGLGDRFIEIDDQWAPRLGVIWDPSGEGRSKFYGSYGTYFLPIASNTNVRMAGNEQFDQNWYTWDGQRDPQARPIGHTECGFGNPTGCENNGSIGAGIEWRVISDGEVPDWREAISTNMDPMSQDELIVGYEQMFGDNWSLGARVVARQFGEVIEDYTIDQGLWEIYGVECFNPDSDEFGSCAHEYRLANPGSDFQGFYDLDGDGTLDVVDMSADSLGYPEAERKYYALEMTFKRRFADNWMLQGSYTWSHLYGNYEGYVNSEIGQDDAGITQSFDFAALMDHSYGNLPQDRRHNLKVFGTYAFDMGLQVGGNFYYRSGRPVNSLGQHPTDPFAAQYGIFSFYTGEGTQPCPRGCAGTTDDIMGIDVMVKYDMKVGSTNMNFRFDIFNLFDQSGTTEVNEQAELSHGLYDPADPNNTDNSESVANPNYRRDTHFQAPRSVRLGVGFNF